MKLTNMHSSGRETVRVLEVLELRNTLDLSVLSVRHNETGSKTFLEGLDGDGGGQRGTENRSLNRKPYTA